MLASILSGVFLLHILFWLIFSSGDFSYTSPAGFKFIWGVSLTHPMLALILSGEFLLHIPCWRHYYVGTFSYTSRASFNFIWGVSLTHSVLASIISGEFLLHREREPELTHLFKNNLFDISLYREFLYTSRAGFNFIWGVSLTHFVLASILSGEFLLHILFWLIFSSGEFLLHITCWL